MNTSKVVTAKVIQSVPRNSGGGFTTVGAAGLAAAWAVGVGLFVPDGLAAVWGVDAALFGLDGFAFSMRSLIVRLHRRKRTHSRCRTAAICPFKSILRQAVLLALKTARQVSRVALVAENHGHHRTSSGRARKVGAIALPKDGKGDQAASSRRRQPAQLEGRQRFGLGRG